MSEPIRVGLIGVGWGSVVQTPAFRMVPEYEVAAICSRRPESVAKAAESLDIPDTSTDWESFVQRDEARASRWHRDRGRCRRHVGAAAADALGHARHDLDIHDRPAPQPPRARPDGE